MQCWDIFKAGQPRKWALFIFLCDKLNRKNVFIIFFPKIKKSDGAAKGMSEVRSKMIN